MSGVGHLSLERAASRVTQEWQKAPLPQGTLEMRPLHHQAPQTAGFRRCLFSKAFPPTHFPQNICQSSALVNLLTRVNLSAFKMACGCDPPFLMEMCKVWVPPFHKESCQEFWLQLDCWSWGKKPKQTNKQTYLPSGKQWLFHPNSASRNKRGQTRRQPPTQKELNGNCTTPQRSENARELTACDAQQLAWTDYFTVTDGGT